MILIQFVAAFIGVIAFSVNLEIPTGTPIVYELDLNLKIKQKIIL